MPMLIVMVALVAQLAGIRGYTLVDPDDGSMTITLPTGRYELDLGYGCDGMNVAQNVDVSFGSGGVASIAPADVDTLCDVFIGAPVSDTPCATGDDGLCDVAMDSQ